MAKACLAVMSKENPNKQSSVWSPVVTCIGVSASKFVDQLESNSRIDRFFFTKSTARSEKGKEASVEQELDEENNDSADSNSDFEVVEDETVSDEQAQIVEAPDKNDLETEPQIVFVDEKGSLDFPDENSNGFSTLDREKCKNPKRTGFFANRNVKKDVLLQTIPSDSTKQPDEQSLPNPETFLIEELFPDLDQIDMETVALLPLNLRRQILQKIEAREGTNGKDNLVICETCNKQLLAEEAEEHKDFHLATELQEEFSSKPSTSKNSAPLKSQPSIKKSSAKRSLKDQKKTSKDCKRSRTIDSFFSNTS